MKKYFIFLTCFLSLSAKIFGQESSVIEVWGDFNYDRYITTNFAISGDAGIRSDVSHGDKLQLFVNPGVAYRLNSVFRFKAKLGLFQTWNKSSSNSTEIRIAQEANVHWPQFSKFSFKNRFKVEERFTSYYSPDDTEVNIPNTVKYRFRYRLVGATEVFNLSENIVNFYALGLAEFFLPITNSQDTNNHRQVRIGAGFGQLLPKGRRYEINAIWEGSYNKDISKAVGDEWIIRLRYYLKTQPRHTN